MSISSTQIRGMLLTQDQITPVSKQTVLQDALREQKKGSPDISTYILE